MKFNEPTIENSANENAPQVLSLEEFSKVNDDGRPITNNFFSHFADLHFTTPIYQGQAHYKKFAEEHPDLNAKLCTEIQAIGPGITSNTAELLKPYMSDLYEAYKIMRGYDTSDQDLFK